MLSSLELGRTSQIDSPVSAQQCVTATLWSLWVWIQVSMGLLKGSCQQLQHLNPVFSFVSFGNANLCLNHEIKATQLFMWNSSFNSILRLNPWRLRTRFEDLFDKKQKNLDANICSNWNWRSLLQETHIQHRPHAPLYSSSKKYPCCGWSQENVKKSNPTWGLVLGLIFSTLKFGFI